MNKRILIVDDSAPIRGLVREFIESRSGLEICGEAADGLDSLPGINGLDVAVFLHEVAPDTPIILFTVFKEAIPLRMAQAAGVASIVSKTDQLATLADEVERLTSWEN
jgi:DNA-binding NarL/FixJ family response regulator